MVCCNASEGESQSYPNSFQSERRAGSAWGAVTFLLWPLPSLKFNCTDVITGVFTRQAIKTRLLQQIFTLQFVLRVRKKEIAFHKFLCSQAGLPKWHRQSHNFILSCLSCFPHIAVSNLCPGQGDRWLTWKTRVPPVAVWMLRQIGCLFHLQAKEEGISGMIWVKNNCFFWQARLDSPWAVVWWFCSHQENLSKEAALGYQDGLSFQHIFPAYQKSGSLPRNHPPEPWVKSTPVVVSLFSKFSEYCSSRSGQCSPLPNDLSLSLSFLDLILHKQVPLLNCF